jgi:hypothetical protein
MNLGTKERRDIPLLRKVKSKRKQFDKHTTTVIIQT